MASSEDPPDPVYELVDKDGTKVALHFIDGGEWCFPSEQTTRRPVYDRYLRRKHHMPLDPPSEAEKQDAILILRDDYLWAEEIVKEAFRVFEEATE